VLIPRVFHWVWVGDSPLPDESRAWIAGWLDAHPGWSHRIWSDLNRPVLANEASYRAAQLPAQRADILRYEVVLRHGGVYLDTDMECLRSVESLIADAQAFVGEEEPARIGNSVFGAIAGHRWLEDVVSRLPESVAHHERIPEATGPGLLTRVTDDHADVTVFPPHIFYPYGGHEPSRAAGPFPGAFAVHRWQASWLAPEDRFQEDFPRQLERQLRVLIPSSDSVVTIAEGIELDLGERRTIPLVGREGSWGNPQDSSAAARELEQLVQQGYDWLVVIELAFWWLDYYREFFDQVRNTAMEVQERHRFVAYRLRPSRPSASAA
jgi:hypothetical protein